MNGQLNWVSETENAILQCAKAIKAEENFAELLEKVKDSAKKDLFLDDQFIEKKFHITDKLQDLPEAVRQERRDRLQNIINQAFINRELRDKGKITTGDEAEFTLLKCLGFNVADQSGYFEKESLYSLVRDIIINQLQQEDCKAPLTYVRDRIHACALCTRLMAAGLTEELQIEKFQVLHDKFKECKEELLILLAKYTLKLPDAFPLGEE